MYHNGCEKTCGMDDLVVLDSGKVVDAVFRSPARHYSGTSSSPHMITAEQAAKTGGDTGKSAQNIKQTGTPKVAPKPDTKTPPATTAPKKP